MDKKVFRVVVIQRKLFITMKDFKVVKVINVIINVYSINLFSTFFNVDNIKKSENRNGLFF